MVNYQNGKIYKIVSNETDMIYIGSTCKLLCQRIAQHRTTYKAYQNGKYGFVTSFKLLEIGECEIILLEKFPCNSREELIARERFYIETMNCVNKIIPTRTEEEKDDNKIRIAEYQKQYKKDHKELISEKQKQYRKDHKELISLQKKQKHMCNCGGKYTYNHKSHHLKTKHHLKHQELQNQTVEIKIEPQIIEEQDEIIPIQLEISKKAHL